jgi:EmrB/QacA subfamily drug resistance transporter
MADDSGPRVPRSGPEAAADDISTAAGVKNAALVVATVSSFQTPFMVSSVNIALPGIQREFGVDAVLLSWVATAYLLASVVALVPFGKLSDILGRRRVFLWGTGLFSAASVACAFAPGIRWLIVLRAVQGAGSAMIFATSMAILTTVFPPGERGKALGVAVSAVYAGLSCGPFLGGLLTQHLGWRSIFLVSLPFGAAVIHLTLTRLKAEWAPARGDPFDWGGALIYALAVTTGMYGISLLPARAGAGLILGGVAGLAAFTLWELRVPAPVFEVRLFRANRVFACSCLAALIHYSATFGVTFLMSLYLQYIQGLPPQKAGAILMVQPLVMAFCSPLAGKWSDRIEPRVIASAGMGITAASLLQLSMVGPQTGLPTVVAGLLVLGLGFALFSSPNMNAIMGSVDKRFFGIASGSVGTMRLMGQMLSMGTATVVLTLMLGRVPLTPATYPLFIKSLRLTLAIFTGLCLAGVLLSLVRGRLHTAR